MSQRAVERILGRLVTDEGFRERFFTDPDGACLQIGEDLSRQELDALRRIPHRALTDFSGRLDDRICRLHVAPAGALEEHHS
ncbi:MAG TPA: Franean1_4349 family RiPP [Candidatus Methylomirabilis sp.]|nr:Franean1_4349 family RiPP [Candidatus Methylomirabilis sp.]HSC72333.1 Franean1_4349 family RiPP [Candidatus Methylomirabilis sp.]